MFISGYTWTRASKQLSKDTNQSLERYFDQYGGPDVCERGPKGNVTDPGRDIGGRQLRYICRGSAFGRDFLQNTASQMLELGATCVHDDQDRGPRPDGIVACYDRSHGHPVPCGPWSTQVMLRAFDQIKADAASRGIEDSLLTKEFNTELFNMALHAYQDRPFNQHMNPTLVPLVQYLNHEYLPIIYGFVTAENRDLRALAAMCVYGQVPSMAFWNAAMQPVDSLPEPAVAFLDDYFNAMRVYAKPYLLYGKMLRPMLTEIPTVTIKQQRFGRQVFDPPRQVRLPQVVQSAWQAYKRRRGRLCG